MIKCKPGNCFQCIRYETEYEFAHECKPEVLYKMDDEERFELAKEVFETAQMELRKWGSEIPQRDAECIGDCLGFLYMFGLSSRKRGKGNRPRYITGEQIHNVLPIMQVAAKKSMQAIGTLAAACRIECSFAECWLRMNKEYDGPRTRS